MLIVSKEEDSPTPIDEDFEDEQNLVAKLVHLIHSPSLDRQYKLLSHVRKWFGAGGKHRLHHTLPPTIFATHRLLMALSGDEEALSGENFEQRVAKCFHFAMNTIQALRVQGERSDLALRFYLQSALIADGIRFEKSASVAYEFVSKVGNTHRHKLAGIP